MSVLRTHDHALTAVGLILACLASAFGLLFVPAFADAYKSLPHLPATTGFLFRNYWMLLVLPLLVLAVWRYWPNRNRRGLAALAAGIVVFLGSQAAIRVVLYLPILELGR